MSLLSRLRLAARQFGIEINRYNERTSSEARLNTLLRHQKIDLVLDVGANDGGYGEELKRSGYEGRILSFEPLRDVHAHLMKRASSYTGWSVAPCMALGAVDGEIDINIAGNSKSSSLLEMAQLHEAAAPQSQYIGLQRTDIRRLDSLSLDVLEKAARPFLKIDTQGFELEVLKGAAGVFPRIVGVQVEMSLAPLYLGQPIFGDLIDLLRRQGFELWAVAPGFTDMSSGRLLQMDGVFFRQEQ